MHHTEKKAFPVLYRDTERNITTVAEVQKTCHEDEGNVYPSSINSKSVLDKTVILLSFSAFEKIDTRDKVRQALDAVLQRDNMARYHAFAKHDQETLNAFEQRLKKQLVLALASTSSALHAAFKLTNADVEALMPLLSSFTFSWGLSRGTALKMPTL